MDQAVQNTQEYAAALKRAENEEIRLLYVGMTRARDYLVFAAREGCHKWLDQLKNKKDVKTFILPQDETAEVQGFRVVGLNEIEPLSPQARPSVGSTALLPEPKDNPKRSIAQIWLCRMKC